jgi:TolA-binding protein
MKKRTVLLLLAGLIGLSIGSVWSDEKKPELTLAQYLQQLQTQLDHAARRANQPGAEGASVVGLRGSKQEAAKPLYWKGKKGKTSVTTDEVKAFRSAVDQAAAGKTQEALLALKAFEQTYPKSALLPDVQETVTRLDTAAKP